MTACSVFERRRERRGGDSRPFFIGTGFAHGKRQAKGRNMRKFRNNVSDGWLFGQELRLWRNFARNWDKDVDDDLYSTVTGTDPSLFTVAMP